MVDRSSRFIAPTRPSKVSIGTSIIILGGCIPFKMKGYGPKVLLSIDNHQLLANNIKHIRGAFPNKHEIILTVGFKADSIIKQKPDGIRIVENQLYETTNIAEELRLAINNVIHHNILIMCGDIIFNLETIKDVVKQGSNVIVDTNQMLSKDSVGITSNNGFVTSFSYGLTNKWSGIAYLEKEESTLLRKIAQNRNKNKCFVFELLNWVVNNKGKIRQYTPKDMKIVKIDSSKDV